MNLAPLVVMAAASAAGSQTEGTAFFETRIRPVLVDRCYKCHSAVAKKKKGDLWVDSRAALQAGGQSGPALVPGRPEASRLIAAIRYQDRDLQMPPDDPLPARVVADFEAWVK